MSVRAQEVPGLFDRRSNHFIPPADGGSLILQFRTLDVRHVARLRSLLPFLTNRETNVTGRKKVRKKRKRTSIVRVFARFLKAGETSGYDVSLIVIDLYFRILVLFFFFYRDYLQLSFVPLPQTFKFLFFFSSFFFLF